MKITDKQLEEFLMDMYKYHSQKCYELHESVLLSDTQTGNDVVNAYKLGQHDGELSAIGAIMLWCFGGSKTFDLWQKCRYQAEEDPDER